jgi:site-specific recombinase XerD
MFDPIAGFKDTLEEQGYKANSIAHIVGYVKKFCQKFNIGGEIPDFLELEKKITTEMVQEYFDQIKPQFGQAKFNQITWAIRRFLKWAMWRNERLARCRAVVPKQKRPQKKIKRTVSFDELVNLIEPKIRELFPANILKVKIIVFILFCTNLDRSVLPYIKRSDFDLGSNLLVVNIPKKRIKKRVLLIGTLVTLLQMYFDSEPEKGNAFNVTNRVLSNIFTVFKKNQVLGPDRLIYKGMFKDSFIRYCAEEKHLSFNYIESLMWNEWSLKPSEIYIDVIEEFECLRAEEAEYATE